MTRVRKFALAISHWVVQNTSTGCKEWAEGLAAELEFIKSDWAALRWAIGSIRVVVRNDLQPTSQSPTLSQRLTAPSWPFFCAAITLTVVLNVAAASNWRDRATYSLVALYWIYWDIRSIANWLRTRNEPPTSDLQAYMQFKRATLQRRLEHFRPVGRWFSLLLVALSSIAVAILEWTQKPISSGFAIMLGLIVVLLEWPDTPETIQRSIGRLDALIAQELPINLKRDGKRLHSDHWGLAPTNANSLQDKE